MSAIRYKIGFTINAETLFTLASKLLPIDDFTVEEMIEHTSQPSMSHPTLPQIKKVNRRGNNRFNPNKGVNKIILDMLADGQPHHVVEADGMLIEAGYSPKGLYSKMHRLLRHGYVFQPRKGLWQLISKKESA